MRKTIELTEAEIHALRLAVLDRIANTQGSHHPDSQRALLKSLDAQLTDLATNN